MTMRVFFCMTGLHVSSTPLEVYERQDEVDQLHAEVFQTVKPPTTGKGNKIPCPSLLDDATLIQKAMYAKNGVAFTALWNGDISAYPSPSEADLALCSYLAFWTGGDAPRMDRLFRQSGLYRDKWDSRRGEETYGSQTLKTTCERTTEHYKGVFDLAKPHKAQGSPGSGPPGEQVSTEGTSRRVELVRADTITPQRTDWLWEGRMPHRDITVMCGDADVGKTMIALEKTAQWTRGQCEGIFKDVPVDVLIASAEDSPAHTLVPRLKAAGGELTRVHFIKLKVGEEDAGGLSLPDDVPLLVAKAKEVNAKVLIVDPLMSHLGDGVNSDKDQHIRKALGPLPALADAEDLTILIICHLNKNEAASMKYRIGGSVGIFAVPRSVLLAAEHPETEGEYVLVHIKCNVGEKAMPLRYAMERKLIEDEKDANIETGGIVWRGEAEGVTATSALCSRKETNTPSLRDEVRTWLEEYLGDGPCAQKAVIAQAKLLGYSEATVRRARKSLGIKTEKVGFGRDSGWTWKLPSKGAQSNSKDACVQDGEHLKHLSENIGGNSQQNQLIPKDAQAQSDEHLSKAFEHLSESETVEVGKPLRGEDDGHTLFPNPDEVDPWN